MALVKGLREGGVINVSKDIVFSGNVTMRGGTDYIPKRTDIYYVDGTDGNAENSGKTPHRALKTIEQAVTKAGNWDRIYIAHDSSNYTLADTVTWSYNGGQIIGSSITPMQPYLDIDMADETTFDPMFEVSGRGNVIANLLFEHGSRVSSGVGYATDLTCMRVSGRYNYFYNVYFNTPFYPEQDVVTTYMGVDVTGHNNYFRYCKFGNDGRDRDKANYNLQVSGVGNMFEDCFFQMKNDGTSPFFVNIANVVRDMKYTWFKNCTFYAHDENFTQAPAYAFDTDAAGGNTVGVILDNCNFVNVSQISDTTKDGVIWKSMYEGEHGADTTKIGMIALRNQGV